mmetsp:Transcript_8963/g.24141  ORF Transcript_8963/g.24141 Transcript_8963/m.24141 type:complete len:221 (-) Transcript_8963:937-1599(-)
MLQHVPRLYSAELNVGILVIPNERGAPLLDERPGGPLAEVLKDELHAVLPLAVADGHVKQIFPLFGFRLADDGAVFSRQPHVAEVGKGVRHALLLAPAEYNNFHVGILREALEAVECRHIDGGHRLDLVKVLLGQSRGLDRCGQGGIVPKDKEMPLARPESIHGQIKVEGGRDALGPELGLHVRVVELVQECVGPGLGGVDRHVHVILPVALPPLLIIHG